MDNNKMFSRSFYDHVRLVGHSALTSTLISACPTQETSSTSYLELPLQLSEGAFQADNDCIETAVQPLARVLSDQGLPGPVVPLFCCSHHLHNVLLQDALDDAALALTRKLKQKLELWLAVHCTHNHNFSFDSTAIIVQQSQRTSCLLLH